MSVKDLRTDQSLSRAEDEMEFTEANLAADTLTQHLAPEAADRLAKVQALRVERRARKRAETRAQARINYLNRALDALTRDFVLLLLAAYKARDAAGYRRYFPSEPPSAITRKGLENQLTDCVRWPEYLAAEPHAPLQALAPHFAALISAGQAAVTARADARDASRIHRLDQIEPHIADLNSYRQGLYATLLEVAVANGLEKSWPREFFL